MYTKYLNLYTGIYATENLTDVTVPGTGYNNTGLFRATAPDGLLSHPLVDITF